MLVALLLALTGPGEALAGDYKSIQCDVSGNLNLRIDDAGALQGNTQRYGVTGTNCAASPLYLGISSATNAQSGNRAFVRLKAPFGAKIVDVKVSANFNRDNNQRPQIFTQNTGGGGQTMIHSGNTSGWVQRNVAIDSDDELHLKLECVAANSCPAPNNAFARIRDLSVTLDDSTDPVAFFGDAILQGGNDLTVVGWDNGSGVERFQVKVNGTQVAQTTYPCTPTDDPVQRRRLRPCDPGPVGTNDPGIEPRIETYTLNKSAPPFVAGANEVEVCARDLATAGGTAPNEGCTSTTVANDIGDPIANVRLRAPLTSQGRYFGYNGTGGTGYPVVTTLDVAGGPLSDPQKGTANVIRTEIASWASVQPAEGDPIDLDGITPVYNQALARGMTPIFIMYGPPQWARATPCPINPSTGQETNCNAPVRLDKLDAWAAYAEKLASTYEHAILEVWNEPNFSTYWYTGASLADWDPDPARYAELARVAAEAVHSVNPDQIVLGGALSGSLNNGVGASYAYSGIGKFLEDAFAAEPRLADPDDPAGLDGISFHLYPAGQDSPQQLQDSVVPYSANGFVNKVFGQVRSALAGADAAHLGLWIDEFGISTTGTRAFAPEVLDAQGNVSPWAGQRGALATGVRAMLTMPDVRAVLVHRAIPAVASPTDEEFGFGVMDRETLAAKPALCQFSYMASMPNSSLWSPCPFTPAAPTTTITPVAGGGVQLSSSNSSALFECQLDGGAWLRCESSLSASHLAGASVLRARAYLLTGVQDETPAQRNL